MDPYPPTMGELAYNSASNNRDDLRQLNARVAKLEAIVNDLVLRMFKIDNGDEQ